MDDFKLFIDGEFVPALSGEIFHVVNPFDNTHFASVSKASSDDLSIAVAAASKAFAGSWSRMLPFDRGKYLRKIADEILLREEEIAVAETKSSGKTI